MLNRKTLQRINEQPAGVSRLPLIAIGVSSLVLAAVLALISSLLIPALAVIAVGALGVLGVYRAQKSKLVTRLDYNLDAGTGARFDGIQKALEGLASAEKVWRVGDGTGRQGPASRTGAANGGASRARRQPVRVGRMKTPGIQANLPIQGIEASEEKILFFPEAVLVLRERYTPVSYESLDVTFATERRPEEEGVPADAEVVGRTWRYTTRDGRPDGRYAGNPEIPVVLYGLVRISDPSGFDVSLLVSNRNAAAEFARTFGADAGVWDAGDEPRNEASRKEAPETGQQEADDRPEQDPERAARIETALKTLGVEDGASTGDVNAAYRELARLYHPDKVANQSRQVRDYAEQRMKEINAAYAQFKRPGRVRTRQ